MLEPVSRDDVTPRAQLLERLSLAARVALVGVVVMAVALVLRDPRDPLALLSLLAAAALVITAVTERVLRDRITARREQSGAGLARTLQQLSRSTSSDAIVDTVIDALRRTADANHILVARLRPVERVVDATLVSTRARVPASHMALPATVLDAEQIGSADAELPPEQRVANEIARRLSALYGLAHTVAAPLLAGDRVVGALILSRRQPREWMATDRRLLEWASAELSAALERAFAYEEVENRANVDALTGLPNRRYLEELLTTVGPRRRSIDRLGVLMIDLDHFKRLNDRYGHATGDAVLRAVAERISTAVRADDTPARYGGEEFAVVLRRATHEQAMDVAERIRSQVAEIPPQDMGVRDPVTVSIGVAVGDVSSGDVHALMRAADRALYQAKRGGRNRVALGGKLVAVN